MKAYRPLILLVAITLAIALPSIALGLEETGSETYSLEAGGRISLSNINGPVTIEGWDGQDVQIDWVKSGRYEEDLDRMDIRIEASSNWIEIETHYEKNRTRYGHDHHGEVEYTVRVPRNARLDEVETVNGNLTIAGIDGDVKASTVNGQLDAGDLGGSVELETVNGSLEVLVSRFDSGSSVSLETVNGSLELTIPAGSDADLEVETVNGRIRNDFGLEVKKGRYVGHSLSGSIGRGGPRIQMESVNGTVTIRRGN